LLLLLLLPREEKPIEYNYFYSSIKRICKRLADERPSFLASFFAWLLG